MSNGTDTAPVIDDEIESLLEEVAREEDFREYKIEKADGSMKGDGYVGIITRIKIVGKNKENQSNVLNLVVKSASRSDAFRSELPVASAFDREIYMYDVVFPTFRMFEMEKGLQPSYFAPKLYKTNITHKNEAIILENLKENGYRLFERRIPMDDGHVSLVMSQYGRVHALSFALRDQNPEKFEKLVGCMDDLHNKFLRGPFFHTFMHRCTKALESLNRATDQKAIQHYQKLIDEIELFLDELQESPYEYSVVLHADCWTNNMMFKYEDSRNLDKPTQVRFIDFQVSKPGSPVIDLAYFFYACSSKEIINNLDYYMRVYYNSLSTHLQKLGTDPEKVFPYSVLQQQWKMYGKFGLIMATMAIHAMLTEKDETIDLKDVAESGEFSNAFNYEISNIDQYNERIRNIILHLVEYNFL